MGNMPPNFRRASVTCLFRLLIRWLTKNVSSTSTAVAFAVFSLSSAY